MLNQKFMFALFLLGQNLQMFMVSFNSMLSFMEIRIFSNRSRCTRFNHTPYLHAIWEKVITLCDGASVFVCWRVMQSKSVKLVKYFRKYVCHLEVSSQNFLCCWNISHGMQSIGFDRLYISEMGNIQMGLNAKSRIIVAVSDDALSNGCSYTMEIVDVCKMHTNENMSNGARTESERNSMWHVKVRKIQQRASHSFSQRIYIVLNIFTINS